MITQHSTFRELLLYIVPGICIMASVGHGHPILSQAQGTVLTGWCKARCYRAKQGTWADIKLARSLEAEDTLDRYSEFDQICGEGHIGGKTRVAHMS